MKVTIVGASGSMSGPTSAASSYLVQADDAAGRTWSVLFDLGPGAFGQLMNHVDPRELDALVLSHLHPDHMVDVTSLQVYLRYHPDGACGPLRTLAPQGAVQRMSDVCWVSTTELAEQFEVDRLRPGQVVTLGPLRVEAYPVWHPVPAFGFRVAGPSHVDGRTVRVGYTGDTDACAGAARLADGVDLLLCEASFQEGREEIRGIHLTGLRAGVLAAGQWRPEPGTPEDAFRDPGTGPLGRVPVGRLVLTHLPPWTDGLTVLDEARSVYGGPIDIARPGASWEL